MNELDELRVEQLRIRERVWALEHAGESAPPSAMFFLAKQRPKWWQCRWRVVVGMLDGGRVYVPQSFVWWFPFWWSREMFETQLGADWYILRRIAGE